MYHSPESNVFQSFWIAGFESATHINKQGYRLDMQAATQHDLFVESDFALVRSKNMRTVRDGVRWHLIERAGGRFDFRSLKQHVAAARQHEVQVIWNLCHYGWPDDVELFSPAFADRFARFVRGVACYLSDQLPGPLVCCPMNEISFLAWAAGETGYIHPFGMGRGNAVKLQLVRAAIAACEAILDVDPQARLVHVEPLIHVLAPRDRPYLAAAAAAQRDSQFVAWDMLCGRIAPELGGRKRYLDIMGLNYYHSNQWEYSAGRLRWEDHPRDDRWLPLSQLIVEVYQRYQRPVFLAETSHFGVGRARWLREIAEEVGTARELGVPVEGVCLYPIIDRPDWDNPHHWHNSGLWDLVDTGNGRLDRVLVQDYAHELAKAQQFLSFNAKPDGSREGRKLLGGKLKSLG